MSSELETRIHAWFADQPDFADFEVERLVIRPQGRSQVIEIFMDRAVGRITMDECSRWNRRLSDFLETTDWFSGSYVVEIASPGADRLLTKLKDFNRVMGRTIKIRFKEDDSSQTIRECIGRLESADESYVVIHAEKDRLTVPYDRILQARQEFTFSKE
jgi:ribosome maturation factor RimP